MPKRFKLRDYIRLGLVIVVFILIGIFLVFIYKYAVKLSQPGGITWQSHGPGMAGRIPKVTVDQSSPNIVYLGADIAGILKSIDGGNNWFPINNGLTQYGSGGVTIDASNHNILYTITDNVNFYSLSPPSRRTRKQRRTLVKIVISYSIS